jgi:acetyl-CoA carboxylase biotin carboxyl carrier protein
MPQQPVPGDRTPAQRQADHASLARLSDTLVPALVAKLTGSGLGEVEVREGDWTIRVRRPTGGATASHGAARRSERPRLGVHAHPPDAHKASPARPAPPSSATPSDPHRAVATSPAVGVFRPGVPIGTRVSAGDRIAIVDLLGIPQDVSAPIDGTLVDVFVESGEVVEYGEEIGVIEAAPDPAHAADPNDLASREG